MALRSGKWTPEEDEILTRFILTNGGVCKKGWNSLAKKAGLERSGKSCRMRWLNYLRPDIKRGAFTSEEDDLILRLHTLLGNRWSLIAGRIPGRTDNEIKNYWNTHLSKKAKETAIVRSQNVSSSSGDHENVNRNNLSCSRDSSLTEEKETDSISEEQAKTGCPLKPTATKGTVQSRTINTVFSSEQTEAVDSKESEAAYYPDLQMSIQELLWAPHSYLFPEFDFLTQMDDSIFL